MRVSVNPAPDRAIETQEQARPPASPVRLLQWSVRRELWQNRAILIGPVAVGLVLTVSFVIGVIAAPDRLGSLLALPPETRHDAVARPYAFAAAMVALGALLVGTFYCLETLQGERSDRSILFWKSLPVADATTVLSKACIPFGVLPLVVLAVTLGVQVAMLLVSTLALSATGRDASLLWRELPLLDLPVVLLYFIGVLLVIHAPLYAWLLMVSAWARRRAAMWAFLPWITLGAAEQMVTGQHARTRDFLLYLILDPFTQAITLDFTRASPPPVIDRVAQLDPSALFGRPAVWIGLAVGAACLFIAMRLRRDRELT